MSSGTPSTNVPTPLANKIRRVFVKDLVLDCLIGVHKHERDGLQRVQINLNLMVLESSIPIDDQLSNVLCYEALVVQVRKLASVSYTPLRDHET